MLTVDTVISICSHNPKNMLVFISFLAFCLTSVFAACPDKWVDASEYDMGKLKLKKAS